MKRELAEILRCTDCKGNLILNIPEQEKDKEDISKGILYCNNCNKVFYIRDGIPDFTK